MRNWGLTVLFLAFACPAQVVLDSSNLPIMMIDTHGQTIEDTPRIIADMKVIDNLIFDTNYVNDSLHYNFKGKVSIEIRGSSSQMFPKKAYSFETKTEDSLTTDVSLLGMPADNDWVLYASYNDKTLMRNFLSMHLMQEMGTYAPRCRYCELIINGEYQGVYLLMEKIKRGKHRVNVESLDMDDIAGDSLTGGYIIKIDKTTGDNSQGWFSHYAVNDGMSLLFYQYHYPEYEEMHPAQRAYIKSFIDTFETIMKSASYNDSATGYIPLIDTTSFAHHVLVSELSRNLDAYRLSTFLYKRRNSKGGKLYAGPLWDYDLAYGMPDYCNASSYQGWEIETSSDCGWKNPFWWTKLFRDVKFHNLLVRHWQKHRQTVLSYAHIEHVIDSVALLLKDPQARNFQRWPVLGTYVWPNAYIGNTYEEEITYMKNWIKNRLQWMDQNLLLLPDTAKPPKPPVDTTPAMISTAHDKINIYPNPFRDYLCIEGTAQDMPLAVEVSDVSGKIYSQQLSSSLFHSWNGISVDGSQLPAGMYFVKVVSPRKTIVFKVIRTE